MSAETQDHLDLRALDLRPGEASHRTLAVPQSTIIIGGTTYTVRADEDTASLDVTHAHTGWHFRLRAGGVLEGPCWRCLEPATVRLRADVHEFGRFTRPAGEDFDEDLDCEYLDGELLDALGMARDGLLDGVPTPILCRPDCAGLCPTCGADLNAGACGCPAPAPDSRWDALKGLAERLEREGGAE